MNADAAKKLHLPAIIEAAGGKRDESRNRGGDEWFFSPFREEKTASLKCARDSNGNWMWTDYGTGKAGNVIAFANVFLGREPDDRGISDSLKWLRGLAAYQTMELPRATKDRNPPADRGRGGGYNSTPSKTYEITGRKHIHHRSNLRYLDSRAVHKGTAARYLEEITFRDVERDKQLYGLGMENEAGGIEITTATATPFKTCIGPKSFTRIKGEDSSANVHVFEGMFDFLTYLTLHGIEQPRGTAFILHSVAMVDRVRDALIQYDSGGRIVLWLDNDEAGGQAAQRLFEGLTAWRGDVATMNHLYEGYKDLNDWYAATRPPQMREAAPKMFHDTAWTQLTATRRLPQPGGS